MGLDVSYASAKGAWHNEGMGRRERLQAESRCNTTASHMPSSSTTCRLMHGSMELAPWACRFCRSAC